MARLEKTLHLEYGNYNKVKTYFEGKSELLKASLNSLTENVINEVNTRDWFLYLATKHARNLY